MADDDQADHSFLKANLVILDTSALEALNYDFKSSQMMALCELFKFRRLRMITHEVIAREAIGHMKIKAQEACDAIARAKRLMGNSTLIDVPSESALLENMIESFLRFQHESYAESILSSQTSVKKVINDYFSRKPPFSDKKPNEFKDSVVLLGISEYARSRGVPIYIISGDKDWQEYAKYDQRVVHLWSVKSLLNVYNSHSAISESVRSFVLEMDFDYDIFIRESAGRLKLMCVDADVYSDDVIDVYADPVEEYNVYVLEISENRAIVSVDIRCEVKIVAEYDEYPDHQGFSEPWTHYREISREQEILARHHVSIVQTIEFDSSRTKFTLASSEMEPGETVKYRVHEHYWS